MKLTSLATILALVLPTIAVAEELNILNTGSETGSLAQETIALTQDFTALGYTVNFENPGNHCLAIERAKKISEPLIMPWASDYEAGGRAGTDCVTYEFKAENVIRYNRTSLQLCTVNSNVDDFNTKSGLIGITPAWPIQERAVGVINKHFNTEHRAIQYNGSGDLKTALFNGEVSYAILSPKHAANVVEIGGHCFYSLGNALPNMPSLPELVNNEDSRYLYLGWDIVFLALNMTAEQFEIVRKQFADIHNNPTSAMYTYTAGNTLLETDWAVTGDQAVEKFEQSVDALK